MSRNDVALSGALRFLMEIHEGILPTVLCKDGFQLTSIKVKFEIIGSATINWISFIYYPLCRPIKISIVIQNWETALLYKKEKCWIKAQYGKQVICKRKILQIQV